MFPSFFSFLARNGAQQLFFQLAVSKKVSAMIAQSFLKCGSYSAGDDDDDDVAASNVVLDTALKLIQLFFTSRF